MGYVTKDIAVITEPSKVSLGGVQNFITFASKPAVKLLLEINLQVNILPTDTDVPVKTVIQLIEPSGIVHAFRGTTIAAEVSSSVFYVSSDRGDTAENLRELMLANSWVNANFDIRIVAEYTGSVATNGRVLNIKSKGAGIEYNIQLIAPNNAGSAAYTITFVRPTSVSNDSISGEEATALIELDVYTGANIKLGADDKVTTPDSLGTLAVTLQKSYAGIPLWFDVNALFSQYPKYTIPPITAGWFNTGTMQVFRFIARKKALNSFPFYMSSALYSLSGYGAPSEKLNLTPYIYSGGTVTLLTNKPRTMYIKGQREYLNFILSDFATVETLSIIYKGYSTADVYMGEVTGQAISKATLSSINTCVLNIDALLTSFPKTGLVRVYLARGGNIISNPLEYMVRPTALHTLTQFTFLNKLGGWDAFNFDAPVRYEVKPEIETYNKTVTPAFAKGASLETVYTNNLEDTRTIEGAPVTDDVAEWLKELAAAKVVLDNEGNYIVMEDFTLPISATAFNMQVPTVKYKPTETFTND